MKPRPRQDDQEGDGLDSLLDTMTNVVGILVMVLIATQLGVKDAVNRISQTVVVDEAAIEKAREKLSLAKQQRDEIQAQLNDAKPADDHAIQVKLAELRKQRQQAQIKTDQEKQSSNQFTLKIEADEKKADAAKKKIKKLEDDKKQREALQVELTKALEAEASLKALIDDTPVQEAPPAKVVTLPDPRAAPEGARAALFLCTNNRVYPIMADKWRDTIRKRAEYVVKSRRLSGGPKVGVDKERFLKEFDKLSRSLRDDFFTIELYAYKIYPRLKFVPRESDGATMAEVVKKRSRFQKIMSTLGKETHYARFIVLPDSYEVYLAARAVADEMGLLAGWDPQAENWQYTTHLGGPILFGPKPPPDPNAKPPKPAPKPQDVID